MAELWHLILILEARLKLSAQLSDLNSQEDILASGAGELPYPHNLTHLYNLYRDQILYFINLIGRKRKYNIFIHFKIK